MPFLATMPILHSRRFTQIDTVALGRPFFFASPTVWVNQPLLVISLNTFDPLGPLGWSAPRPWQITGIRNGRRACCK